MLNAILGSSIVHFLFGLIIVGVLFVIAMAVAPKGWRTVVTNALAGIPLLGTFATDVTNQLVNIDFTQYLDKKVAGGIMMGLVVCNIFLRAITDTAMGKK